MRSLFNRETDGADITVTWSQLGLASGSAQARDPLGEA
jgi:hypothetical protein